MDGEVVKLIKFIFKKKILTHDIQAKHLKKTGEQNGWENRTTKKTDLIEFGYEDSMKENKTTYEGSTSIKTIFFFFFLTFKVKK